VFNPEFLNRVDDVIVFKPLEKKDIFQIIDILTEDLFKRIINLGFTVDITKGAKDFLTDKGFDQKFGARPLRRAIQKYVEDPLAEELLRETPPASSTLRIKMKASREGLMFEWKTPNTDKPAEDMGKDSSESKEARTQG